VDSTLAGFHEFWFTSSVQEIVLYSSPIIVRVIKSEKNETSGACSAYGGEERRGVYMILVTKTE